MHQLKMQRQKKRFLFRKALEQKQLFSIDVKKIENSIQGFLDANIPRVFLLITSAMILVVAAASLLSSIQATEIKTKENANLQAALISQSIQFKLDRTYTEIEEIAHHLQDHSLSELSNNQALVAEQFDVIRDTHPEISALSVIDQSGVHLVKAGKAPFSIERLQTQLTPPLQSTTAELVNGHTLIITTPIKRESEDKAVLALEAFVQVNSIIRGTLLDNENKNSISKASIALLSPDTRLGETHNISMGFEPKSILKKRVALRYPNSEYFVEINITSDFGEEQGFILTSLIAHMLVLCLAWSILLFLKHWTQKRLSDPLHRIKAAVIKMLDENEDLKAFQSTSKSGEARSNLLREIINSIHFTEEQFKQRMNDALSAIERKRILLAEISRNSGVISISISVDSGKIIYFSELPGLNLNFLNVGDGSNWKSLIKFLKREDRHNSINAIRELLIQGKHRFKVKVPTAGGESFYEIHMQLMHGFPRRVDIIAMDNTEKIVAEIALSQSEARKEALISGAIGGFLTLDEELNITYANPAAYKMLRREPGTLVGLGFTDHCIAPGSLLSFRTYLKSIDLDDPAESADEFHAWCRTDENISIPLKIRAIEFSSDRGTEFCLYLHDLSNEVVQRKEINRKNLEINTIFSLSPEGFASFDRVGRLSAYNKSVSELLKLAENELHREMTEDEFLNAVGNASSKGDIHLLRIKRKSDSALSENEEGVIKIAHKENEKVIRFVRRKPAGPDSGASCLYYFSDISEQHALHAKKSKFLATAAHELRTPLTTIMGFSEFLSLNNVKAKERNELINSIYRHSSTLNDLINDLLDLEKIDANGSDIFNFSPTDISALLRKMIDIVAMRRGGMHYMGEHPLTTPSNAQCILIANVDREKLSRAVINLLSNAAKYSAPTAPITLDAENTVVNGSPYIEITVRDRGIGMSNTELERAFDRFWRAERASQSAPGTGLGLSLVKEIIEKHKGTITLTSVYGEGTLATLRLPAHEKGQYTDDKPTPAKNAI